MCDLVIYILLIVITVLIFYIYCSATVGQCVSSRHLVGKVVIVTGGTSGIGFETALDLAERGARVIIASNEAQGENAKEQIVERSGNSDVRFLYVNLSSFSSVRLFAEHILSNEKRLDVLINNAGVCMTEPKKTEDGFLLTMQVNYLSPFLLTNLLLPLLIKTAPSRIINVSSMIYTSGRIDLEDINKVSWKGSMGTYANSKMCIALMTLELDRRLHATGVTANFLHPGCSRTKIINIETDVTNFIYSNFIRYFTKTPKLAAQTSIHLAVSPDVQNVSGCYFVDCGIHEICAKAKNIVLAKELWILSEKLVNIKQ